MWTISEKDCGVKAHSREITNIVDNLKCLNTFDLHSVYEFGLCGQKSRICLTKIYAPSIGLG